MTSTAPIHLLVADDHPIVTQGMQRFFATSTEHSVLATATCVSEVLEQLEQHDIDIAILDIQMPGLTGPEAISEIAKTGVKIILYSLMAENALVASLINAGATGFVSKAAPLDVLSEAINVVHAGETYLSDTMRLLMSDSDPPH
ncbi:MAG: response regulator transcription factor, partial [Kofleriaceae bacterium]|nr:response regulator transcription factor [Kofleriaceae bacterium]